MRRMLKSFLYGKEGDFLQVTYIVLMSDFLLKVRVGRPL